MIIYVTDVELPPDGMKEIERNEFVILFWHIFLGVGLTWLFFPDFISFIVSQLFDLNLLDLVYLTTVNPVLLFNLFLLGGFVLALHESVHTWWFNRYEYIPNFTFVKISGIVPTPVVAAFNERIPRKEFIRVAIAPLIFVNIAGVVLLHPSLPFIIQVYGAAIIIFNTSAAADDLYVIRKARREPGDAEFMEVLDEKDDRLFVSRD